MSTGPCRPKVMETCPEAILAIIIGTAKGFTLPGPFCSIRNTVSSMVAIPPIPVPITVPAISGFSFSISNLASSTAIRAAATANWALRSICRIVFLSPASAGSKSFTSPAIFTGKSAASNRVIGAMPDLPSKRLFQNFSTPVPTGDTTPRPVITTLLSILTKHLTHIIWIRLPVFYIPLWDKTSKKRMAETAVRFFEVFSAQRPFGGIKAPDACHVPV